VGTGKAPVTEPTNSELKALIEALRHDQAQAQRADSERYGAIKVITEQHGSELKELRNRLQKAEADRAETRQMARDALDSYSDLEQRVVIEFSNHARQIEAVRAENVKQTDLLMTLRDSFVRQDERAKANEQAIEKAAHEQELEIARAEQKRESRNKAVTTWTPIALAVIAILGQILLHFFA
jgi:hypothetical protein